MMDLIDDAPIDAPTCLHCGSFADLTNGREVYPHLEKLWSKPIWKCRTCPDSYCGCHPGTETSLGHPADKKTRRARQSLHNMRLDPLWRKKKGEPKPLFTRNEVYRHLQVTLDLEADDAHTGMWDIDMCRKAWVALQPLWDQVRQRKAA